MPCSSKLSLTYRLLHQNLVCISLLPHMCHITSLSHRPWFHQFNTWWGTQIMKLPFMQLPTGWCYCLPLRNKFQSHVSKSEALRNTHAGGPPVVDCIFNIFIATVLIWLPFRLPQLAISAIPCCQEVSYRGADKSLARPGRKLATATEDFEFQVSYL
jgi:hypothetical protein